MRNERGFSPILILGIVLLIGVFVFLYFFFKQNNQQLEEFVTNIPPGVVTDENGVPCETQDAEYCHESVDVETWTDDNLP